MSSVNKKNDISNQLLTLDGANEIPFKLLVLPLKDVFLR
jgi:hypothetical protein